MLFSFLALSPGATTISRATLGTMALCQMVEIVGNIVTSIVFAECLNAECYSGECHYAECLSLC
jgi:hypothetical protein